MNKRASLTIIAIIYLFGIALAVWSYRMLPYESMLLRLFVADIIGTLWIFLWATVLKNASLYDPYWSVAPPVILIGLVGTWSVSKGLLLMVVGFWSIRLTLNWAIEFKGLAHQDWRYDHYKARYQRLWPLVNLFGIMMMPTVIVFAALMPAVFIMADGFVFSPFTMVFVLTGLIATVIQWRSDTELRAFRKHSPGSVMDQGLWSLSRHPNYFGELLFWGSLLLMALSVDWAYAYSSVGFIAMVVLFLVISIPLMEKRQRFKKPEYETYMKRTNMLLPLPKEPFKRVHKLRNK